MRPILQIISILALLGTIGPPLIFLVGGMDVDAVKLLMLIATILWFVVAPFAWERGKPKQQEQAAQVSGETGQV